MELGLKIITVLELKKIGVQQRTNRQYQVIVFDHDKDVFKGMYYLDSGIKLHPGDKVLTSLLLTGKVENKTTAQGQPFIDYNTFFILNKCVVVGKATMWEPPKQNPQWVPQSQQQTINEQEYNTTRQAQLQEQEQEAEQGPTDEVLPDWMSDMGD